MRDNRLVEAVQRELASRVLATHGDGYNGGQNDARREQEEG
jgi:hypothetical protein